MTNALIGAVLVLALAIRVWGLDWGLPWAFQQDEKQYADRAAAMLRSGELNPGYFRNPSLLTYVIAGELWVTRALGPLAGDLGSEAPAAANMLGRITSALAGAASVWLVFLIGARLFDRRVGLLAALFLAVSFLHVRDSHYGVNDVPATALLLVSLYACARILERPALRWYLLAGLAGGLATSTKYNMGFFCLPILAAHVLAARGGCRMQRISIRGLSPLGRGGGGQKDVMKGDSPNEFSARPEGHVAPNTFGGMRDACRLALAAIAAAVGYLLGTPYTVLDFPRFAEDFAEQYQFGAQRWLGQPLEPVPLLYLTTLLQGFGGLPLGLVLVGLLARRSRASLVLLAFPVAYLAFLLPKALFFPRFVVPLLPYCSLLAGLGAAALVARVPRARRGAGPVGIALLAVAQPLVSVVLHNRLIQQADTRVLANEWVEANVPAGSRVKIEDYSLQDMSLRRRDHLARGSGVRIERFEGSPETDNPRFFAARGVQYVVTSSFISGAYALDPARAGHRESRLLYERLHRGLDEEATLVARFSPGVGGREVAYREDDTMTPFWSLEEYERPGPTIRIYSLAGLDDGRGGAERFRKD